MAQQEAGGGRGLEGAEAVAASGGVSGVGEAGDLPHGLAGVDGAQRLADLGQQAPGPYVGGGAV